MGCAGMFVAFILLMNFVNTTGEFGAKIVVILFVGWGFYKLLGITAKGFKEIGDAINGIGLTKSNKEDSKNDNHNN